MKIEKYFLDLVSRRLLVILLRIVLVEWWGLKLDCGEVRDGIVVGRG